MAEQQGMTVYNQTSQSFLFQITYDLQNLYTQVVGAGDSWAVPAQFPCDQWILVEVINPPGQPPFAMVYQALNSKEVIFADMGGAYALNCTPGVCAGGCDTNTLFTGAEAEARVHKTAR